MTTTTHTINVTASYYDPKGIPPRCRKPQPTYFTVRTVLEVQEVPEEALTLAAEVKLHYGGTREYYTVIGQEGFFIPSGTTEELLGVDYSLGGIFPNNADDTDKASSEQWKAGEKFFGLGTDRYYHEVKIADAQLAQASSGEGSECLLVLQTYGEGAFNPQGELSDEQALEYLRFRASNLLVAGEKVYQRVPEPMVQVDLTDDTRNAPTKAYYEWDLGYSDKLEVKLRLVAPDYMPNPLAGRTEGGQVLDYLLQSVTAVEALVEQFIAETLALEGTLKEYEANVREDYQKQVEALGVTVHNPEVFSAAVPVPTRKVRAARYNLAVGISELRAHYGAGWKAGQRGPMKAEDLQNLLEVMTQAKTTLETAGEELFLTRERLVEVAAS